MFSLINLWKRTEVKELHAKNLQLKIRFILVEVLLQGTLVKF